MSDVGNDHDVSGITLKLDDQAAAPLSVNDPLTSGSFQPEQLRRVGRCVSRPDAQREQPARSVQRRKPEWILELFVVDYSSGDTGQLAGGWSLQITAEADVQVQERVPSHQGQEAQEAK